MLRSVLQAHFAVALVLAGFLGKPVSAAEALPGSIYFHEFDQTVAGEKVRFLVRYEIHQDVDRLQVFVVHADQEPTPLKDLEIVLKRFTYTSVDTRGNAPGTRVIHADWKAEGQPVSITGKIPGKPDVIYYGSKTFEEDFGKVRSAEMRTPQAPLPGTKSEYRGIDVTTSRKASVTVGEQTFTVEYDSGENRISVRDGGGRTVSYPARLDKGLESQKIQVIDGILKIDGANRLVDLREFKGEVDYIGDTWALELFPEKDAAFIEDSVESFAPDLVAREREAIRLGKSIELEETSMETSLRVLKSLKKNRSSKILGEAGSGKSKEMEILALRVAAGKMPGVPRTLQIRELSLAAFQVGTQYVGQSAEKAEAWIRFARAYRPVFVADEFHSIVGVGSSSGQKSGVEELMKAPLERGELRLVAISTRPEWNAAFARNAPLNQRFDEVQHEAPVGDELTKRIRNAFRLRREKFPPDEVIREAIALSDRYAIEGGQPRSAVNLLLKAGEDENWSLAGIREAAVKEYRMDPVFFSPEKVADRVEKFGAEMRKVIVGQESAVDAMEDLVLLKLTRARSAKEPDLIGFFGPPGTGKSFTPETAAKVLGYRFKRIDMGKYANGDVDGFAKEIYEALTESPFTVFLFDELEKAALRVQNAILPMAQNLEFTLNYRDSAENLFIKKVRCGHAIFSYATNAGQEAFLPKTAGIEERVKVGFRAAESSNTSNPANVAKNLSPADFEKAVVEGGVSEPLVSRTPILVGMPRPTRDEFRQGLVRELDRVLESQSIEQGRKIRIVDSDVLIDHLMKSYTPFHTDYRDIGTLMRETVRKVIARSLIRPEAFQDPALPIAIRWSPEALAQGKRGIDCVDLLYKQKRQLLDLRSAAK